jgi:hypothetical protein
VIYMSGSPNYSCVVNTRPYLNAPLQCGRIVRGISDIPPHLLYHSRLHSCIPPPTNHSFLPQILYDCKLRLSNSNRCAPLLFVAAAELTRCSVRQFNTNTLTSHIMRPPRVIIAVVFFVTTVILTVLSFRSSNPPQIIETASGPSSKQTGLQAFFSLRTPFSLFPPNAIITLTHENSTAFLARPAAFGPPLPVEGLKGQVWIGSGFGDDGIRQGPAVTGAEGELGCSDVPGWMDNYKSVPTVESQDPKSKSSKSSTAVAKAKVHDRTSEGKGHDEHEDTKEKSSKESGNAAGPPVNDGTDDYLHHPLPGSSVSKTKDKHMEGSKGSHADIQSIQESAEIAGKVVLLSRGGCGFLEKVKWAQRRGAIALIVGDDTKGGPLIQMYARGDTSNVTIPSIFTSRTTAHLLSSLIGPGSFLEDALDENGKPVLSVHHTDATRKSGKKQGSQPTFTQMVAPASKATATSHPTSRAVSKKASRKSEKETSVATDRPSWFRSLFFGPRKGDTKSESSRPPSSGQLDWVLVDDWKDDDHVSSKKISTKPKKAEPEKKKQDTKSKPKATSGDDFVIGVQDWRDPDLLSTSSDPDASHKTPSKDEKLDSTSTSSPVVKVGGKKHLGGALQEIPEYVPSLRGGSITPGSGEYGTSDSSAEEELNKNDEHKEEGTSKGLLTTIFGDDEEDVEFLTPHPVATNDDLPDDDNDELEGLWVTLTPTSGASPFLDTLLVLVVSPLVTLTVVYALLLIRSRIRRRRWRAPKSVVERLPVRTYQTVANISPQPSRIPAAVEPTVTTPLLQHSPPSRPRPRSRTTSGIPEPGDIIRANSNPLQVPSMSPKSPEPEKHQGSHTSEWRKYMGKQVECVVCLEEYVDGVSRVMSLPCGHEFHVDCM